MATASLAKSLVCLFGSSSETLVVEKEVAPIEHCFGVADVHGVTEAFLEGEDRKHRIKLIRLELGRPFQGVLPRIGWSPLSKNALRGSMH